MANMGIEKGVSALLKRVQGGDVVDAWARKMAEELKQPPFQRDPAFIRRLLPYMELMSRYFAGEVRGLERAPAGPVMLVGNHSGGTLTPDTTVLLAAWFRSRGVDDPLALLALDALFAIPEFKTLCRKLGLIPASEGNAGRAIDQGCSILVYPGGAHEAFRPYSQRNQVDLMGRKGFIRLALRRRLPVVPVVAHGGHDTLFVLSRGEGLARKMGMERMRLGIFPVLAQLPWGVSTPMFVGWPLPAKITVELCEPLDWSRLGPEDADDPRVVDCCYEEISSVMQARLTRLARETPRPLLGRLRAARAGRAAGAAPSTAAAGVNDRGVFEQGVGAP
jgi:1-acyl-sn-glycerol-3-phosphate acyltransferase